MGFTVNCFVFTITGPGRVRILVVVVELGDRGHTVADFVRRHPAVARMRAGDAPLLDLRHLVFDLVDGEVERLLRLPRVHLRLDEVAGQVRGDLALVGFAVVAMVDHGEVDLDPADVARSD